MHRLTTRRRAEEIPRPRVNVPKAMAAQVVVGLISAFSYSIAILYAVNDFDAVFTAPYTVPLAEIYRQATNSRGGSFGLLMLVLIPSFITGIGAYVTAG